MTPLFLVKYPMKYHDVIVIGAGIVGLATAYQISLLYPNLSILVLEKECKAAVHQTGNNSGVIHSGIYYKPGSLKARNCIEGRTRLLSFCNEHTISYQKVTKLIVATEQRELLTLYSIFERGKQNGINGIELIQKEQAKEIEPHANVLEAILIPECYIINYAHVADTLVRLLQKKGHTVLFNQKVVALSTLQREHLVETNNTVFRAQFLINCAGLFSDHIAQLAIDSAEVPYKIIPFRGEYYELSPEKASLVRGLIYPVPDPNFPFLGVHLTRMINGTVEAGPNAVLAFAREGYAKYHINPLHLGEIFAYPGFWKLAFKHWKAGAYEMYRSFSKRAFLQAIQRLLPPIEEKDIHRGGAGIRAQVITRAGTLLDDFAIKQQGTMIHVLNAPSPAATASLSIGHHIATLLTPT